MGLPTTPAPRTARRGLHAVHPIRRLLLGRPTPSEHQEHARLPKILALPVFSSDAISSVAYATQQILLALGAAGLWTMAHRDTYARLTLGVTAGIVLLLVIVATSYWQTIFAYPSGGGSYIVSKDNLGPTFGLIAGAALLIDYILTVAVSIASGVQNMLSTPLFAHVSNDLVPFCLVFVLILTFANLRGLKESGTVFALPTYSFIFMSGLMILMGVLGHLTPLPAADQVVPQQAYHAEPLFGLLLVGLVLRAFANGCSAMTGVEAVSNGIPAFRKPESRNAALTLVAMAATLGVIFLGISWLAVKLHVVYWEYGGKTATPVIDQLSSSIFGHGRPLYYLMQFATTAILVLAANTSYADFPRLSSIMARDGYMPRQLANLGDKLVFSNGIVLLGIFSAILLVAFHGQVDLLIPLYAVGVFTAFTLSQGGMVKHWLTLRGTPAGRGWHYKVVINGVGAVCTGVVLLDIIFEKGPEGAWIVVVLVAVLFVMFRVIHSHYTHLRDALTIEGYVPPAKAVPNTVLILVPRINRGVMAAIQYGRSLAADVRAVHIETDAADTPAMKAQWEKWVSDIPLVVLPSPYRSIIGPLLAYLDEVERERPGANVTVVVPEVVTGRWWHSLLHANYGAWIKLYLLNRKNVIVSNVRYFVEGPHAVLPPNPQDTEVRRPATVQPDAETSPPVVPPHPVPSPGGADR